MILLASVSNNQIREQVSMIFFRKSMTIEEKIKENVLKS